jgi:hypothetical protein
MIGQLLPQTRMIAPRKRRERKSGLPGPGVTLSEGRLKVSSAVGGGPRLARIGRPFTAIRRRRHDLSIHRAMEGPGFREEGEAATHEGCFHKQLHLTVAIFPEPCRLNRSKFFHG